MNQIERLDYLIDYLLDESEIITYIPKTLTDKKLLLRSLMNIREPKPISKEFLFIQDAYLQEELTSKKVTDLSQLSQLQDHIYLYQGDITLLKVDAIVNAANNQMLGCFVPNHRCIDNAIHTYAGIQLRLECYNIMKVQETLEPTGKAKITKGYNLPAKYVIHTVGPITQGKLTNLDCELLRSCYQSCLKLADAYQLKSIAFCCISTGEFRFPQYEAASIAIDTVKQYMNQTHTEMEVIFNVFKDEDKRIYEQILRT
ncbi:MAG: protein-ADP-ribose hydrolase [Erysipelotrichaceae bacterium]|nr:protein-ADP-ribose hydrolase [Erysipelotrichaceae bacterium]